MNNRISLVNRELHMKIFDNPLEEDEQRPNLRYRKKHTEPEAVLKGMVKRGLSHTAATPFRRPRTAHSVVRHNRESRMEMGRTNSAALQSHGRWESRGRHEAGLESGL